MKRVLVTGADGFIGNQVLKFLSGPGVEAHGVGPERRPAFSGKEDFYYHRSDLLDSGAIDGLMKSVNPTHLLHLAWYTEHGKYRESPLNVRWVESSLSLFTAFAERGGRRFVGAGTCAEYDWTDGWCSEETTPKNPASLYGISKYSLYRMLNRLAAELDVSFAWGRLFFLYGPREQPSRLIPSIIRAALKGRPFPVVNWEQRRDFLYVEDAASALVKLLDSDVVGAVNIGSGVGVRLGDLVGRLAEKLDYPEGIPPRVHSVGGGPPVVLADIRRLKEEVGWQPIFDLSRGLDQTIKWWREQ